MNKQFAEIVSEAWRDTPDEECFRLAEAMAKFLKCSKYDVFMMFTNFENVCEDER
jgi:hypothetical protein